MKNGLKRLKKNIRREIKIDIDNNEFIEEIFGNYIDKNNNVLITCLDDVKSKIWHFKPWKQNKRYSNEKNNLNSDSLIFLMNKIIIHHTKSVTIFAETTILK